MVRAIVFFFYALIFSACATTNFQAPTHFDGPEPETKFRKEVRDPSMKIVGSTPEKRDMGSFYLQLLLLQKKYKELEKELQQEMNISIAAAPADE